MFLVGGAAEDPSGRRSNVGGGAERVALELHRLYKLAGHDAILRVGHASGPLEAGVSEMENRGLAWSAHGEASRRGHPRLARLARAADDPGVAIDAVLGREDFRFPATARLADVPGPPFELADLHNLHGGYFDLRELAALSHRLPVVVTPHDMWLATGHGAESRASAGSPPAARVLTSACIQRSSAMEQQEISAENATSIVARCFVSAYRAGAGFDPRALSRGVGD